MNEAMPTIAERLRGFICDELGYEPDEIQDDTLLFSTGMVDSFTFVGMVALIETHLGEQLDPRDITVESFDSMARIEAFLQARRG